MKHQRLLTVAIAAAAVVGGAAAVMAHQKHGAAARAGTTGSAAGTLDTGTVDPDAIAALEKMGAYLRTLRAIQVHAVVTTEEVALDGQKVQSTSVADLIAQRPNRLRVEVANDRQPRFFFYDGKTFTLWAPSVRYFATTDAPSTIGELADRLEEKYDIDLPFVDLFRWGTSEANVADIKSAMDVGPAEVDGATCEQYTFRQDGLDWQVWIQSGEFPLPRKLVLTTMTDEARPQHTSLYTWNLAPSFNEKAFTFDPPADAKRITFAEAAAKRAAAKQPGEK